MRKMLAIGVAFVMLLIVGGIAYASIPGSDGVIHGCYKNSHPAQGALIAIDSAASCPSGYTALNWNQQGPQGSQGPPGLSDLERVQADGVTSIQPGGSEVVTARCSSGKLAIAGGWTNPSWDRIVVSRSVQSGDMTGWTVGFGNPSASPGSSGAAFAICATVSTS